MLLGVDHFFPLSAPRQQPFANHVPSFVKPCAPPLPFPPPFHSPQVRSVHSGTSTLKDATSEAIRDWVTNVETTHYILGSAAGPHPYPMMVWRGGVGRDEEQTCT